MLPTVADCKQYLRIENTVEDALIAQLLARALALSQKRLGCPITALSMTQKDRAANGVFWSSGVPSLMVPITPFDPTASSVPLDLYLDIYQVPFVVAVNVGTTLGAVWMALLSGNTYAPIGAPTSEPPLTLYMDPSGVVSVNIGGLSNAVWMALLSGNTYAPLGAPTSAPALALFLDPSGIVSVNVGTAAVPVWMALLSGNTYVPVGAPGTVVVVTDADGTAIDSTTLDLDGETGIIRYRANRGAQSPAFSNGPYTIVASVGISTLPTYTLVEEPLLQAAIIDFVSALYHQRSPSARSESAAGGVRVDWTPDGIPARVAEILDSVRRAP